MRVRTLTFARLAPSVMLVFVGLTVSGCVGAMQTKAHDAGGTTVLKPTAEDRDAGLVGIAPGFQLKSYPVVAVDRIMVTEPEVNDDEDRRLATEMPVFFQTEVVRRLRESALFQRVVNLAEGPLPGEPRVLRVEGSITRLAPGSRALRYLVGFGAGRSKAQTELRFVDVQSGQVVLVTADRRVAAYGMFGGDSRDHLRESFDDMARDLAKFLVRLSQGQAPQAQ